MHITIKRKNGTETTLEAQEQLSSDQLQEIMNKTKPCKNVMKIYLASGTPVV